MIKNLAAGTLILGLAVLPNLNAAALVLDFSNVNNAEISFNGGGNFAFVAPSVTSPDFQSLVSSTVPGLRPVWMEPLLEPHSPSARSTTLVATPSKLP